MKTIIQIHKEGKYFIAAYLVTNVADQGLTEEEALANLKKGLEKNWDQSQFGAQKIDQKYPVTLW